MGKDIVSEIKEELKKALKEKDREKANILRLLLNSISQKKIEIRGQEGTERELTEEEVLRVLQREAKKREEAIQEFQEAGREDLIQKEKKELEIIKAFLPPQLSEEELREIVKEIAQEKQVISLGELIQKAREKVGARAPGSLIAKVCQEILQNGGGSNN